MAGFCSVWVYTAKSFPEWLNQFTLQPAGLHNFINWYFILVISTVWP